MSEVTSLKLIPREERGKGACSRLRAKGIVPGVYYSKDENISFSVENLALGKAFEKVRYSKLIELEFEIDGKVEKRNAMFKKLEAHPVKRRYDHVDFIGIDLTKPVTVKIPVTTSGRAKGIVLGGKLEFFRDQIVVRCLPTVIPDCVNMDITNLNIGDKVMVDELPLPEGVEAVYDRSFAVLTIKAGRGSKTGDED